MIASRRRCTIATASGRAFVGGLVLVAVSRGRGFGSGVERGVEWRRLIVVGMMLGYY